MEAEQETLKDDLQQHMDQDQEELNQELKNAKEELWQGPWNHVYSYERFYRQQSKLLHSHFV